MSQAPSRSLAALENAGPTSRPREDAPLFTRELVLVMAMQAMFGISFSSFLILPKFLKLELGANAEEIGWMAAAALGSAAVFAPLVGFATTRFDRRLILLVAILAEAGAAIGFLQVEEVGGFALLLRCAQGLAFVAVFTSNTSLVADTVPNHQLSRALGYLGTSMLATNALAPLLAEPLATRLGWNTLFVGAAVMSFCTLLIIARLPRSSGGTGKKGNGTQQVTPANGKTKSVQYGSLLMGAGLGVMFTYVQPFAIERGATEVGQLFLGYAAAATAVRVFFGGLADRIGPARASALALVVYALTVLASSQLQPNLLIYLGVGLGVAHGFLYPALSAAGLCVTSRASRGRFLGWFAFSFNAGFALTVLLLGPIADRFGYAAIFIGTGSLLLTGVPSLLRFKTVSI